jgi:tetratricopeptide (TPR) repeat protein
MELIRFVASDNPNTKISLRDGTRVNFLPGLQYTLTIDRDDLLERGIITEEQYMFTVSEMQHDIEAGRGISRSDLALLDILATNNWERPIFVTSAFAQRSIWPIEEFAQMEGIIHRFVPYHNPNRGMTLARYNGVNTDRTYDLFMNVFPIQDSLLSNGRITGNGWGNLNHPKARIGPDTRRHAEQHRISFLYLAQALIVEGKVDSAIRVLDQGLHLFPHHKVNYDFNVIFYVQTYLRAGEREKGLALAKKLTNIYETNLRYFERFPSKHRRLVEREIEQAIQAFASLHHFITAGLEEDPCEELPTRLNNLLTSRNIQFE